MMTDAGSDPRIKNRASLTPYQLVDPRNVELKHQLQDAVDIMLNKGDFVEGGEEYVGVDGDGEEEGEDVGSASDSDFDQDEYRRERERRKQAAAI